LLSPKRSSSSLVSSWLSHKHQRRKFSDTSSSKDMY
jgi:hypothetical protein